MRNQEELEKKAFWRLIGWTLVVLIGVTAINVLFIINAVGTDILKPIERNIASVSQTPKIPLEKLKAPVIMVNCNRALQEIVIQTKSPNARVAFTNCKEPKSIVNESNGTSGLLFPMKKRQWTSDFIPLKVGTNLIKAQLPKDSQTIIITREKVKKDEVEKAL